MRYKKYLNSLAISIFAVSALAFGSFNHASASFWDWFKAGNDSQPAVVSNTETTYKWVNNGLVSETENFGRNTGTCAKKQVTTYTCSSSNVGNKLYDGTDRGASYNDVGHAWPIYEGENTSTATEYTWSGCGLDRRTGGQVNEWECKASNTTTGNSSSSSSSNLNSVPKITSPNGGENWQIGTSQNILFYSAGIGGRKAKILLVDKNDSGANTWSIFNYTIADIILGNEEEGLYSWTWKVGDAKRIDDGATPVSGSYKIKICIFPDSGSNSSNTVCDNSDAPFIIISGGSSSSSSSTSAGISAITGGADYDSAHATAYLNGTIYNTNKENVSYYFNYRKETEPSSSTKQTVWATINSGSSANVTALTSSLSSGTKYVYRLYVYSNTTGATVSGDLKSFTTLSSSGSSSSSASSKYNLTINNTSTSVSATISLLDIGTNNYINDSYGNLSCSASNGGECNFSVEANHKVKVLSFSYSNGYYYYADWGNAGCSNQGINSTDRSYCEVTISANKQIDIKLEKSSSVNSSSSSRSSNSSSSTSANLTVTTGVAEYSSTNANLSGTVNNPKNENVYYYFNYRKEKESSTETKQTSWTSVNNASLGNIKQMDSV